MTKKFIYLLMIGLLLCTFAQANDCVIVTGTYTLNASLNYPQVKAAIHQALRKEGINPNCVVMEMRSHYEAHPESEHLLGASTNLIWN